MKLKFLGILGCLVSALLTSCKYDNYEEPGTTLQGRIVYNGEPIPVEFSNADNNVVYFELWEPGWQTQTPIRVTIDQDGSYSAVLFHASYKLIIPRGQGPFMSITNEATNSDTIMVNVQGNQTLDIEVMPYYMVRNPQFAVSGRTVSASCQLEPIIMDSINAKNVERVSLYLSKTAFVDSRTSVATSDLNGSNITNLNAVSLNGEVPALIPAQNYVFARIGVKISGVEDMIFSPIQKVDIQ